jgi:hypothetical protein
MTMSNRGQRASSICDGWCLCLTAGRSEVISYLLMETATLASEPMLLSAQAWVFFDFRYRRACKPTLPSTHPAVEIVSNIAEPHRE